MYEDLVGIQDAQGGGVLDHGLDVLHEGQRSLPQAHHLGPAGHQVPHSGADMDFAAGFALKESLKQQFVDHPVRGGHRKSRPAAQFGDAHGLVAVVEGAQNPDKTGDD